MKVVLVGRNYHTTFHFEVLASLKHITLHLIFCNLHVTCVDTLAERYLLKTSVKAGSAAEIACTKKHEHVFKALAFEILGTWAEETMRFFDK